MANFQEIQNEIASKVEGDNSDEVKTSLKQLGSLFDDATDKVKAFGSENKEKRLSIGKLETQIRDLEDNKNKLSSDLETTQTSSKGVLEELETLRQFKVETLKTQRNSITAKIDSLVDHPKFEKASQFFNLPDQDKDGKYKWDKMTEEQVEHNQKELTKLTSLDYFAESQKKKVDGSINKSSANTSFFDKIQSAKSIAELKTIQNENIKN